MDVMRSLFRYLIKNYAFVLFITLEIIAFTMIFNNNKYQKAKYLNSSNKITGSVYSTFNGIVNYFELAKINQELSAENARLKSFIYNDPHFKITEDSIISWAYKEDSAYQFVSARVINNSVNNPHNYITLNKGRKHGLEPDQGIVTDNGIVGVITNVSESYSMGLSVLNRRWSVSAKLKDTGYFGSLYWRGNDYRVASLMEIPFHVDVQRGDTVVTSGYSSVFPEGILIGTISNFDQDAGENYYNIEVELSTDFKSLSYVEVIKNLDKEELDELEVISEGNGSSN